MLWVYTQTICTYFTLPQVELISLAEFYGDTGRLSKFCLNLSGIIIIISVIHAKTCYTTESGFFSCNVKYVYIEYPLTLSTLL